MSATASAPLPSLRRRLICFTLALAVAILAILGGMLVSIAATHGLIEDSRAQTLPRVLERQRATANLERLIRFGWIAATSTSATDWRQASITAQALAFHPSLSFDNGVHQQVLKVHTTIRQVVALRDRAQILRGTVRTPNAQADDLDRMARDLWMPQESVLVALQGRLADDAARLMVERFDQLTSIADTTRLWAIGAAGLILLILAATALVVWRNLLWPVLRIARSMRAALAGTADPTPPSPPATAEIAVMQDAATQLRDELHRAALRAQAMKASEQRLASIFATSEAAIILTSADGVMMQANGACLRLLGQAEALSLDLRALVHPDDHSRETALRDALIRGETEFYRLDKRLLRADGSWVWVDAATSALRDDDGIPLQFVTVAIDISERIRSDRELRFIRDLVAQSADPIYCLDPEDGGRMVWANAATCRHFGMSLEHLTTLRIHDWDPNFDEEGSRQRLSGRMAGMTATQEFETTHRIATGELVPVEVSSTLLEHDGKAYLAGYIRDIRERNRMLNAVRRSNEDLQQFAYVASHDLQEPLRMVASFLQLLERRYGQRLDAAGREYIQFAVDGAVRMKRMIEDLLAFSRIDTRGEQPQSVEIAKIAQEACDNLVSAIADNGGRVTLAPDLPIVLGDPPQLLRLMQNLIGNALKYRAPDRFPEIYVWSERHGERWVVAVQDNGIGISPDYHDRIFMIFQRLHGIGTYEGTGIGLAICKRIVERHGGEIWVESQESVGSVFKFTLAAAE